MQAPLDYSTRKASTTTIASPCDDIRTMVSPIPILVRSTRVRRPSAHPSRRHRRSSASVQRRGRCSARRAYGPRRKAATSSILSSAWAQARVCPGSLTTSWDPPIRRTTAYSRTRQIVAPSPRCLARRHRCTQILLGTSPTPRRRPTRRCITTAAARRRPCPPRAQGLARPHRSRSWDSLQARPRRRKNRARWRMPTRPVQRRG